MSKLRGEIEGVRFKFVVESKRGIEKMMSQMSHWKRVSCFVGDVGTGEKEASGVPV